ncbi:MAG: OsmC family protein [Chitinophagaceae bacterium]
MTSLITYKGALRTDCLHLQSGSSIETDAPTDNQGKGERFSPTDLIATSLASCMLTTMAIRAKELEDKIVNMKIEVEKVMGVNPRRIAQIKLHFHCPEHFRPSKEEQITLEQIALTCPVKESIHPDIKLDINFNWPQ